MPFSVLWAAASGISAWSWVQRHLPAWHLHRAQGDQSPLLCGNSWGLQLHAGHWVLAGFVWCVNLAQFFRVLTLIPPDCTFQIRPAAIKTGSGERSLKPKRQCRKRWQCNSKLADFPSAISFIPVQRILFSITRWYWFSYLPCINRAGENKPESALAIRKQDGYF